MTKLTRPKDGFEVQAVQKWPDRGRSRMILTRRHGVMCVNTDVHRDTRLEAGHKSPWSEQNLIAESSALT